MIKIEEYLRICNKTNLINKRVFKKIEKPKISIITPVYNKENSILRYLRSIQNQLFDSIEIIIIDDKSIDNSIKIIEEGEGNNSGQNKNNIKNRAESANYNRIISDIDDIKSSIKNIESKTANIKTIDEIEEELRTNLREGAEIKDFDLRYFEIDDPNFKNKFNEFLSKREEIIISCYSIEEGIYCILNYLKYIKKYYNVYVINDEETWNNLDEKNIEGNILIANFFSRNVYKKISVILL